MYYFVLNANVKLEAYLMSRWNVKKRTFNADNEREVHSTFAVGRYDKGGVVVPATRSVRA